MEQVQRISQENLRLLEQQRQFLQDASHELGTPITVALGHAELIERAATDQAVAADARVVTAELARLRRLTNRLLLLASAGTPDFLRLAPVSADALILDALERWGSVPRRWRLGEVAEATVLGDGDRLVAALDALLENAVAHTEPGDTIEVSVRGRGGNRAELAVTDTGCGIPPGELDRIFGRFARAQPTAAARDWRVRARPAHRAGHRRSPPRLGPGAKRQRRGLDLRDGHSRRPRRRDRLRPPGIRRLDRRPPPRSRRLFLYRTERGSSPRIIGTRSAVLLSHVADGAHEPGTAGNCADTRAAGPHRPAAPARITWPEFPHSARPVGWPEYLIIHQLRINGPWPLRPIHHRLPRAAQSRRVHRLDRREHQSHPSPARTPSHPVPPLSSGILADACPSRRR